MNIKDLIQHTITDVINSLYQIHEVVLEVQDNKTDFEGDFTIVTFPLVKQLKKNPELIGQELGGALTAQTEFVESYNTVKGFLNLKIKNQFFIENLKSVSENLDQIQKKN